MLLVKNETIMEYIELNVWVKNRELTNAIYAITKKFPPDELYGIINQMRRAAVSTISNIAEGCGRCYKNESIHFYYIARGSLYELEAQCYISYDQGFINETDLKKLIDQISECKKLLNGFINYFEKSNLK
jgi:four helix bundle protein